MFNVIIIGAEDTCNYEFFKTKTASILSNKARSGDGITIFTTGDSFVDAFTKRYGIAKLFFPCDFKTHGRDALKYRNEAIVENANAIIFFQNGKKDSKLLYNYAKARGLACRIINPPTEE